MGRVIIILIMGIGFLFRAVWKKGALTGVLVVLLVLQVLALMPIYRTVVENATYTMADIEIVEVKQVSAEDGKGTLDIKIRNNGSEPLDRAPFLIMKLGDANCYLDEIEYYQELRDRGMQLYVGKCLPAGEEAVFNYEYELYRSLTEGDIPEAKIVIDDYTYGAKSGNEEYVFDFTVK